MSVRDIIVVGASAGGVSALQKVLGALPADLPAAVFVTMHMFNRVDSSLAAILDQAGKLRAKFPKDGEVFERGFIYVAPPDYHLVVHPGSIELQHGPRENLQRPCINVMFRSAAAAYGKRVVGVVLTGLLDDGAAGLWEIQQQGGCTIVQDPEEASARSMPDSAIAGSSVEYILKLEEMSSVLARLTMTDSASSPVPAEPAVFEPCRQACPECGGVMKAARYSNFVEYTCHVGHRLGAKSMILQKSSVIERSLWNAVCQTEELIELLEEAKPRPDLTSEAVKAEIATHRNAVATLKGILQRGKLMY